MRIISINVWTWSSCNTHSKVRLGTLGSMYLVVQELQNLYMYIQPACGQVEYLFCIFSSSLRCVFSLMLVLFVASSLQPFISSMLLLIDASSHRCFFSLMLLLFNLSSLQCFFWLMLLLFNDLESYVCISADKNCVNFGMENTK